ncbi:MAG: hypothetical protein ABIC96_01425 [Patescibacteria group bacterium]
MLPLFRKIFFSFAFIFIIFLFLAPKSAEAAEARYYYYYSSSGFMGWSNLDLSEEYYREDYYNFPTNPADNSYFNQCSLSDWASLPDTNSCQKNLGAAENTCCTGSSCSSPCGTIGTWNWCYANGCQVRQRAIEDCSFQYQYNYANCGAYDVCTSPVNNPYLNPGQCSTSGCTYGSTVYKTCCNSNGTVDGSCSQSQDSGYGYYYGSCPSGPGYAPVMCNVDAGTCAAVAGQIVCTTQPCGSSACAILTGPVSTPTPGGPTPTSAPPPTPTVPAPPPLLSPPYVPTGLGIDAHYSFSSPADNISVSHKSGDQVTLNLDFTNRSGKDICSGINLNFRLPSGLTFVRGDSGCNPNGTDGQGNQLITCNNLFYPPWGGSCLAADGSIPSRSIVAKFTTNNPIVIPRAWVEFSWQSNPEVSDGIPPSPERIPSNNWGKDFNCYTAGGNCASWRIMNYRFGSNTISNNQTTPTSTPTPTPLPCPTNLQGSCSIGKLNFSWNRVIGAVRYAIRIWDRANPIWGGDTPNPGDTVDNYVYSTFYERATSRGPYYTWWIHSVDSRGVYSQTCYGNTITCGSAPTPTPPISGAPPAEVTNTPVPSGVPTATSPPSSPTPTQGYSLCFFNYANISVYAFSDSNYDPAKWPYYTWTPGSCGDTDYLPPSMQNTLFASLEKIRDNLLALFKPKTTPKIPLAKPKLLAQTTTCTNDSDCTNSNPCKGYYCNIDYDSYPVRGTCASSNLAYGTVCGTSVNGGNMYCNGIGTCLDTMCTSQAECNDGNPCTNDFCDIDQDDRFSTCRYTNKPQGTVCATDASGNTTKVCDASGSCSIGWTNCTDPSQNDSACCGTTNIQLAPCGGTCSIAPYPFPPSSTVGTIPKKDVLVYAVPNQNTCNIPQRVEANTDANGRVLLRVVSFYSAPLNPLTPVNYKIGAESFGENFTRGTHYLYKITGTAYSPIYQFKDVHAIPPVSGKPNEASYSPVVNDADDVRNGWTNYLSFGFTPPILPWFQGVGGDIRIDYGVSNPVPDSTFASLEGGGGTPGIIFTGNRNFNFCKVGQGSGCQNKSSTKKWVAGGPAYPEVFSPVRTGLMRTSFDYYVGVARQSGLTPIDLSTAICPNLSDCSLPGNLSNGLYIANSGLSITNNNYTFQNNKNFVILVNGTLTLKGNIHVPKGSTVTFSASDNIVVDKDVGGSAATSNANLEGFFSTDKNFILEGNNNCAVSADKRLNIEGSVVVNAGLSGGSFQNRRDLCTDNPTRPSVYFKERPDMILNAPEFLKHPNFVWQEVAP